MINSCFITPNLVFCHLLFTVDHAILLKCLHTGVGLEDAVLPWFSSYLFDKSYRVKRSGSLSAQFDLLCGVSQGSVLGPLLFLVYTFDVHQLFTHPGFLVYAFADDFQAYASCLSCHQEPMVQRFRECSLSRCHP